MTRADPRTTGGALIGSLAAGAEDRWSDIDITFGIATDHAIETILDDWTQILEQEFGVLSHFDLRSGPSIYRVFLLPDGLEIDLSVTPEADFGARGPNFQRLFGTARQLEPAPQPDASSLIGLSWHHVLHARSSIERHKPWRAEYWIGSIRDYILALACLRKGENAFHGRGVDLLPASITDPLAGALVRSLDESELRRALAAATRCLIAELEEWDHALCARLKPLLLEFGDLQAEGQS
ncbi:MAG TPA: hypothetical protein VKY19_25660 [Ktedonosporobacter sp.]|jgi:hypothetical protein|nr:hypothetical protein [Ktedonosporobacter sp.]